MHPDLAPERLLAAYASGIFPMADEDGELFWMAPDPRAVIDIDTFNASRSLRAVVRRAVFEVSFDRAFDRVIESCADRVEGTWISGEIKESYGELHRLGFAHSVEAWQDEQLVGGLYGVAICGAFFGESMFHHIPNASKVALVHLVQRLRDRSFTLLDVQFMTEHLKQFGTAEIPKFKYELRLHQALSVRTSFIGGREGATP